MYPLDYLKNSINQKVTITLKCGDVYTGKMDECDKWMNIVLTSVEVVTHDNKEKTLERAMIRGNSIQSMSMPREVVDIVKSKKPENPRNGMHWRQRGGRGNYRGRGGRQNPNNNDNNNTNRTSNVIIT